MYEGFHTSYVIIKGRWGRLRPKVRFGGKPRPFRIWRGHDGAMQAVVWSLSGLSVQQSGAQAGAHIMCLTLPGTIMNRPYLKLFIS
jgi:hypothetical protein